MSRRERNLTALGAGCVFALAFVLGRWLGTREAPQPETTVESKAPPIEPKPKATERRAEALAEPEKKQTARDAAPPVEMEISPEVRAAVALLASADEKEWQRTQRRLVRLGAKAVPALLQVVFDRRANVQQGARNVLSAFSGVEYATALLAASADPALTDAASRWMRRLKTEEEAAPIAAAALDTSLPRERRRVLITILAELKQETARNALLRLARDDEPRLRSATVHHIWDTPGKAITDCLLAAMKDPTPRVVEDAIRSLGKRRAIEAVDALNRLVAGPLTESSVLAATALGKIGDPRAVPVLAEALEALPAGDGSAKYARSFRLEANKAIQAIREAERTRARPAEKARRPMPPRVLPER